MAKKKNNKVEEAMNLVKEIMQDPKELEIYESIQKARMDHNSGMRYAREEGLKEGEKSGKMKEKKEIAKAMLKENADINFIIKVTGLDKKQIENIKNIE